MKAASKTLSYLAEPEVENFSTTARKLGEACRRLGVSKKVLVGAAVHEFLGRTEDWQLDHLSDYFRQLHDEVSFVDD